MVYPDGLPTPRRYWSTLAIGMAITMAVLDTSIINIALPTIARDFRTSEADAIWAVNAYQIVVTVSILPLASLGDRLGHRLVYQVGLVVFTLASLACAMSDSLSTLIMARTAQGLGAAGVMSMNGALIRFTYPLNRLGMAIGVNAVVVATASALGPTIAAAVLSAGSWRWLFGINVPLGVLAVVLASLALPATRRSPHKFDLVSAVLSGSAFGLVIYGLDGLAHRASIWSVVELTAGIGAGWIAVRRSLRMPAPLVPVDLLKLPRFGLGVATSTCSFIAYSMGMISLPFLMQASLGRTAVETGLLMTPWPLAAGITAPLAGALSDRVPAGLLGGVGLACFAAGLALLAMLQPGMSDADIIWRMALCGMGFALFQAPNNRSIMFAAPVDRAGAAGGTLSTARLMGSTLGAAGLAMLFRIEPALATRIGLGVAASVAAVAAGVSCLRLIDRPAP